MNIYIKRSTTPDHCTPLPHDRQPNQCIKSEEETKMKKTLIDFYCELPKYIDKVMPGVGDEDCVVNIDTQIEKVHGFIIFEAKIAKRLEIKQWPD